MLEITNKNVYIVTYATHEEGMFNELIKNKFNVKIDVLGFGEKWINFMQSMTAFYEYMKKKNDEDIIILIDAFDVCLNSNIDNILERFEKYNTKILVSKDVNTYFTRKVFGVCRDNQIANTGMIMGYNKYLKIFFETMIKTQQSSDDQREFNRTCSLVDFDIKVDVDEIIFKNIRHKDRSSTGGRKDEYVGQENFLGFPAQHNVKRITRAFKEYTPFFKTEIFIIVLVIIIIVIIYYLKKI